MGCEASVELPPNYVIVNQICSTKLYNTYKVKKTDSSEIEIMKQYISRGRRLNDRRIFQKEIEEMSKISHPYILKYRLIVELNNSLVVIMPQIKMNLLQFAETTKYTTKMQLMIIKDVVVAISYLHKKGFEHGNLKPSNVLICEDLSKCLLSDYSQNIIYNSYRAGIPYYRDNFNYLSPETLLNKEITDKSDIWSLGMLIYFIIERKHLLKSEPDKRKVLKNLNSLFSGITVFESMGKFLKKVFIYNAEDRMDIDDLMKEIMVNEFIKIPKGFEFKVTEEEEKEEEEGNCDNNDGNNNINNNKSEKEEKENKDEIEETYNAVDNNENKNEEKNEEEKKDDNNNNNNNNNNVEENDVNDDIEAIIQNEKKKAEERNNNAFARMMNGNNANQDDNMKMIEDYIKSLDPKINTIVDFSDKNLCDEDITFLCGIVSSLSFVKGVNVSGNRLSNKGLSKIGEALENNKKIQSINISGNKTTLDFTFFFISLGGLNLTEIIIDNARLGDSDLIRFSNGFCDIPQLINLELAGNNITDNSFKTFSEEMVNLSQIQKLNFSRNSISDDGLICFVDRMSSITTLRKLNLNKKSVSKLIDQLSVCTNLKGLEIVDNNINNAEEILATLLSLM